MKVTWRQIEHFVWDLPIDVDYESHSYTKVVMEQHDLQDRVTDWLKSFGVEVVDD